MLINDYMTVSQTKTQSISMSKRSLQTWIWQEFIQTPRRFHQCAKMHQNAKTTSCKFSLIYSYFQLSIEIFNERKKILLLTEMSQLLRQRYPF